MWHIHLHPNRQNPIGVVVAAQLLGQLLPIPEVHGSTPVIGKTFISNICILQTV